MAAWRSQEMLASIRGNKPAYAKTGVSGYKSATVTTEEGNQVKIAPGQPTGYPSHFYDSEGLLNLSKVTGVEAFNYFKSLGIVLPVIPPNKGGKN